MSKIKEFTVDRKTWARGGKNGAACLLNDQENMCCLGFLGEACGIKKENMRCSFPSSVNDVNKYPVVYSWSPFMEANDSVNICDNTREKKLRKLFKEIGIIVHFKG